MEKLAEGFGLIEGPVWDPQLGLVFADVIYGGVHCLSESGALSEIIPHRKGIGGMTLHADGGYVVSGRNIAIKKIGSDETRVLLDRDQENGIIGFNDITADSAGRIYAGSLAFTPVGTNDEAKPGALFCIDLDGSTRQVGEDVLLTNGLGFSPDGKTLYHSESRRNIVRAYDVADDGSLSLHRTFANVEGGVPDGLVVGEDGSVWVAVAYGSRVDVFEADGKLRDQIEVPLPMVTSVCFGGSDRKDFYIVTGSQGADSDRAGSVFKIRTDVAGLEVPAARVAVPD